MKSRVLLHKIQSRLKQGPQKTDAKAARRAVDELLQMGLFEKTPDVALDNGLLPASPAQPNDDDLVCHLGAEDNEPLITITHRTSY